MIEFVNDFHIDCSSYQTVLQRDVDPPKSLWHEEKVFSIPSEGWVGNPAAKNPATQQMKSCWRVCNT